mmetsp:Transcript_29353/g.84948  ORF Transcript_29353/g.84948 Transcript_29353/m.84948 type:complete len:87 (-) Transcript_29353:3399-3659(-)
MCVDKTDRQRRWLGSRLSRTEGLTPVACQSGKTAHTAHQRSTRSCQCIVTHMGRSKCVCVCVSQSESYVSLCVHHRTDRFDQWKEK